MGPGGDTGSEASQTPSAAAAPAQADWWERWVALCNAEADRPPTSEGVAAHEENGDVGDHELEETVFEDAGSEPDIFGWGFDMD